MAQGQLDKTKSPLVKRGADPGPVLRLSKAKRRYAALALIPPTLLLPAPKTALRTAARAFEARR